MFPSKRKAKLLFQTPMLDFRHPDPDERALAHIVNYVGEDRFFWATDYPHFDHPGNYMQELEELVSPLSETARNNLLGDSVANVYGI